MGPNGPVGPFGTYGPIWAHLDPFWASWNPQWPSKEQPEAEKARNGPNTGPWDPMEPKKAVSKLPKPLLVPAGTFLLEENVFSEQVCF